MIKSVGTVPLENGITVEKHIAGVLPLKYSAECTNAVVVKMRPTSVDAYKETSIMPYEIGA